MLRSELVEITKDKNSRQPEIDGTLLALSLLLRMSFPIISSFASGSRNPVAESCSSFWHTLSTHYLRKRTLKCRARKVVSKELESSCSVLQLLFTNIVWLIGSCGYRYEPSVPEGEDFDQWEEVGFCSV